VRAKFLGVHPRGLASVGNVELPRAGSSGRAGGNWKYDSIDFVFQKE
jgi:hypothetical protein